MYDKVFLLQEFKSVPTATSFHLTTIGTEMSPTENDVSSFIQLPQKWA